MPELTTMRNIGREMASKLVQVGICSAEELAAVGARQAFLRLRERYLRVCLVHLYALEGAVRGVEIGGLSEETKRALKAFCGQLKQGPPGV